MTVLMICCLSLVLTHTATADKSAPPLPPERVIWDSTPIRVVLPVGEERLVQFPARALHVGIPGTLSAQLRTISNDGTVYWLAREAFDPQRVVVEDRNSGKRFLVDLEAREDAAATRLVVMLPGDTRHPPEQAPTEPEHQNLDFIRLTRFAAQQMYAPSRLRPAANSIHRIPLQTEPVDLLRGSQVEAVPLIAWRGGNYHVTVIRLTSVVDHPVELDPRNLRGAWLAATFQHNRLHPAGSEADTTALYLISRRPFEETL